MKKTLMAIAMLMATVSSFAQLGTKIQAQFQEGEQAVYRTTSTVTSQGQDIALTSETRYTVTGKTADGYTIEAVMTNLESSADENDIMGKLLSLSENMMKDVKVVYKTDADGQVTGIANYEEASKKVLEGAEKLVDGLLAEHPEIGQMMPREALLQEATDQISEENLVKSIASTPNPLAIYGKTAGMGNVVDHENEQGMKVRSLYFLTSKEGPKVKVTTALNMTKDELKQYIIDQVTKMMPDQAEMIKQNIDMVMESGMMKMEMNTTSSYEFLPTTWVKTITSEQVSDNMGQQSTIKIVIEQVSATR